MTEHIRPRDVLPASLPPRGLRRPAAAAYVGVGMTTFDQMVVEGLMPQPRRFRGCVIWDRLELDEAFASLPSEEGAKTAPPNPWDAMSNV